MATISRYTFAFGVLGMTMAWAAQAMSPASPGGEKITKEEVVNLINMILSPLGITVDSVVLMESLKDLV
jgi:hypothetical protein